MRLNFLVGSSIVTDKNHLESRPIKEVITVPYAFCAFLILRCGLMCVFYQTYILTRKSVYTSVKIFSRFECFALVYNTWSHCAKFGKHGKHR